MKNKTIKKALAIGMSVLMLASTFTPVSVQADGCWKQDKTDWGWEGGLPHYTGNDVEGIARMIQETLHLVPPSGEHDEFGKDKRGNDGN